MTKPHGDQERERRQLADLAHITRLTTLSEMGTGIAHELNQPLAAIVSYTGACVRFLTSDATPPGDLLDAMQAASAQARRASEIVRRWRRLVRKAEPHWVDANLNDLVLEILAILQHEFQTTGCQVHKDLAPNLPIIHVDTIQIQQVILNLLRNALEAMLSEDRTLGPLRVRTFADGNQVELQVQDTGPGLHPEVADRLFESFVTTKISGLGMGLAICRTILEVHQGRVWMTPNEGPGVTFHVRLPVKPE